MATDAADLFCEIFDEFEQTRLNPHEVNEWLTDEQVIEIASDTEGRVIETGTLDADEVRESIEMADDDADKRRFAFLHGIDTALLHAHPHTGSYDTAGLNRIATRYVRTGKLNSDAVPGALLPRYAFPADDDDASVERLADAMGAVVRVSPETWAQTEHVAISPRSDFTRLQRERGITYGCVPFIERPDELHWEQLQIGSEEFFRSQIIPSAEIRERIATVLTRLDAEGAMVGVVPELCACREIVEWWKEEIAANPAPRDSNLRWIMLGTGPVEPDVNPPRNTAVLMDRLTGDVLMTQDKLHAFRLRREMIDQWQLADYVGVNGTREDITPGETVSIAECALGRLCLLICEDLARSMEVGPPLLEHGLSHAICPVFSDETEKHHWEHNKAKDYADQVGTQVVIANSRAIGCNQGEGTFGTALAHSPHGTAMGSTSHCMDIVLLRLSDEAAVRATARTAGFEDYEEHPSA